MGRRRRWSPAPSDARWVGGTWDLKQFEKDGKVHWDSVIDAVVTAILDVIQCFEGGVILEFDHPKEKSKGRAAMIGFFMAYFVDSLTGVGLVDQMRDFFCKTLLFVAVAGVLLIRKNEDLETIKKLLEETTYYDKQWQASWKDEISSSSEES
ncbi:hypothetical protein HAX54_015936 [Datura stramonium]|uniref:Uncharacterized protein n=1 Tax=Datura stramonium TaxID=4076 RepID=A0ABS8UI25_DATST|nr:hypothetical protein [Datura stramonium]